MSDFDTAHAPVLVTGAGHRIGLQIVKRLLESNRPVIAHYHRDNKNLDWLQAQGVMTIQADLTHTADIERMVEQIKNAFPALSGIIHNASAFAKTSASLVDSVQQFDTFYRIHMLAPFLINERLGPLLLACREEHSNLIHITDIYADKPNSNFDLYCASKAGLQNLALSYAQKLAPKVKVNVIQPGPILFKEWHSDTIKLRVINETLLKKEGGADAIALAVMAILINPYQTGSIVAIDGGRRLAQ